MIVITAKIAGFRRAGIAHPGVPTEYPEGYFGPAQLAQLQAEPMLVVEYRPDRGDSIDGKPSPQEELDAEEAKAKSGKGKKKKDQEPEASGVDAGEGGSGDETGSGDGQGGDTDQAGAQA